MTEKLPAPEWLFEQTTVAEVFILLSLSQAAGSVYQITRSIPYDSEGTFRVTYLGVRGALARILARGWVRLAEDQPKSSRGERLYVLTEMGAGQLEYSLRQWRWAVNLGEYRVRRWRQQNEQSDRMEE